MSTSPDDPAPEHLRHSSPYDPVVLMWKRVDDLEDGVRSLEDWRLEMRTVWRVVQLTFGTSLLAAFIGIANLIASLSPHP